jgi:hypothetical protein
VEENEGMVEKWGHLREVMRRAPASHWLVEVLFHPYNGSQKVMERP